jgi:hypothetical protein
MSACISPTPRAGRGWVGETTVLLPPATLKVPGWSGDREGDAANRGFQTVVPGSHAQEAAGLLVKCRLPGP